MRPWGEPAGYRPGSPQPRSSAMTQIRLGLPATAGESAAAAQGNMSSFEF